MPTFGSLFAGIGGLDLGLERAGWECRWQVEIDPFCQRVLAKHWPDVARYGDIATIDPERLARVDLVCGGFPCQDISKAGRRRGLDGNHSGLWREFARIIRLLRPQLVLVENVPSLLQRGLDAVLGDLAAFGFDAEWSVLPANYFGAPHIRERIFLVAYARRLRNRHALEALRPGRQGFERSPWWDAEPDVGRLAHGIPPRLVAAHYRALGNAVVPQVAEWIGRRLIEVLR